MTTYSFEINKQDVKFIQNSKDIEVMVNGETLSMKRDIADKEYTKEEAENYVMDDIEFFSGTGAYDGEEKGGTEHQQELAALVVK